MNNMPICQFMFDATEADDIISITCNELHDQQKVIISSDKDFYQLADDKTIIYRPVQNQIINKKKIIDEFGIHPNNFAISRAICGDNSDNLKGVKGAGLATLAKRFPFLKEEKSTTFDDIFSYCSEQQGNIKLFESILSSKDVVQKNYKLMQLYAPSTQPSVKQTVRECIKEYPQEFNKNEVKKMLLTDGIGELDWSDLFSGMNRIAAT